MLTADDVVTCRDECVTFLETVADRDWSTAIPDLEMNVMQVIAHVTGVNVWYALDLAAGGVDADAIYPRVSTDGGPESLIIALNAAASLLATTVRGSSDDVRGFHPFGQGDRSGFAGMSCDEMIVHTHDVARGFGVDFAPSPELASKVLHRLFPWATEVHDDPWIALQWANGRIALPEHERLSKWRWHCAPLSEWDGTQPRPPAP